MTEVSVDWITFSFPEGINLDRVLSTLHLTRDHISLLPSPLNGYSDVYSVLGTSYYIMIGSALKNHADKIYVSVSGKCTKLFFDYIHIPCKDQVLLVLSNLLDKVKFSRIDIAIDDIGAEYYTCKKVYNEMINNHYVSRIKSWEWIEGRSSEAELQGETVRIGKRGSNIYCRVYNKKLEHNMKLPDEPAMSQEVTRWELEMHDTTAQNAVDLIVKMNDLCLSAFSILTGYIRFIKPDNNQRTRCSTAKLWDSFTHSIAGAKISDSKKITTIDEKEAWLLSQCSKAFALCTDSNIEFLDKIYKIGSSKYTEHDLDLIRQYCVTH